MHDLPIVLRRMVASFLSHIVASPDAQHPPNAARRRRDQADGAASGAIRVTEAGRAVALTATEYELQRVLSFNAAWPVSYESTNIVRIFIRNLRRKLCEDAARPACIFNERGVGYRSSPDSGLRECRAAAWRP